MRPPPSRERDPTTGVPVVTVGLPDGSVLRFHRSFHIGRDFDCEVQIQDGHASRRHAQVSFARGQWVIHDLQSSNGLFVDGERVESAPVGEGITVRLGEDGPSLEIGRPNRVAESPPDAAPAASEDSMIQRYFNDAADGDEEAGGRTVMIRNAFKKVKQKQQRQTRWMIAIVALLGLGASGYAYYLHQKLTETQAEARGFFYDMKVIDVLIAGLQQEAEEKGIPLSAERVKGYETQRLQIERRYEQIAERAYGRRLSDKERLILRVTRLFGECDVAAPQDYLREVTHYIDKWRTTKRYEQALKRAQDGGYARRIAGAFMARQLPAQYFYLAMQESDFIPTRSGPPTRFGIAKGMWQFIPETGKRYGLRPGPLVRESRVDLEDERLNWERATTAAASYIKDIYATDAQASGLLVMASYNWGERRVVERLKKMPANPRERNFWLLLARYPDDVPPETYNYVFSIVSAAVIGEDPRLFGFPFDNPLAFANSQQ